MTNRQTILIVGASRGLSLALVEQFCRRDWHVIGTVRDSSAALDALKARFPSSLDVEIADIGDEASVRALHRQAAILVIGHCRPTTPACARIRDYFWLLMGHFVGRPARGIY